MWHRLIAILQKLSRTIKAGVRVTPERITTDRLELVQGNLELSKAEVSDRNRFAVMLNARVLQWPPPLNDESSMKYFLRYFSRNPDANGWGVWYFILNTKGEERIVIGNGGFKGKPAEDGTVELGYSILEIYQNKGYASEAVRALLLWAFRHASVRRVIAETLPGSAPSIRVLEKCRFRSIGAGSAPGVLRFELRREEIPVDYPAE